MSTAINVPERAARPAPLAQVLVLSCIDYRLADDVGRYLSQRGLDDRYSEMRVPGAGLAAIDGRRPAWVTTVWETVAMSRQIHGIRRLYVVNHRDCSAVSARFGRLSVATPEDELRLHRRILQDFALEARRRFPDLEVELGFMELDGSVRRLDALMPAGPSRTSPLPLPPALPEGQGPTQPDRARFTDRVRARVGGEPLNAEDERDLLRLGVVEHGLSAEEATAILRSTAGSDGRRGREGDRTIAAMLTVRADRKRRVSQQDFEATARLLRAESEAEHGLGGSGPLDAVEARRRVKAVMEREGFTPRAKWCLLPFLSRWNKRWYTRI
jgi:hypothetical protein